MNPVWPALLLACTLLTAPAQEQAGPLSPEDSAKSFTTPDDLEFEQLLAEPVVAQPVFITFDERGRMWVVQYLQYPAPAGLTLMSKDQFWRAVYDKVPSAPPNHTPGADKITIHEDTDHDGRFDSVKTFVDGLNIVTSCAISATGVWVLNPPYLLFYPDKNRDDKPDSDPEVHLAGFGLEDTHSVVNSLRWGPDGWLYAAQGSTVSGEVIRPGLDKEPVRSMGQHIWRYHPQHKIYEIFSEGGGNAFGVEIDDKGRIFSGHNGGDTRGFHYVQGGYLQKGFEKHGPLSNPYAFGYFRQMPHNKVERFTHNFVIYGGGSLPEKYHGTLFGIEPLQGRVVMSDVKTRGSSFETADVGYAVTSKDKYFKPVDIKLGPDGAIYVADWYDRQVTHTRNYEGQIDKSNGRIYRLKKKGSTSTHPPDLARAPTAKLVDSLRDPNRWVRQTTLRLLTERRDQTALPLLRELLRGQGQPALEALWALQLLGEFDQSLAAATLEHPDPHVRAWAVRLLGDPKSMTDAMARRLPSLARGEPHVEVRSQLASTARRLPAAHGLPLALALLEHPSAKEDPYIPLLIWWAIEAKASTDRAAVMALFRELKHWTILSDQIAPNLMKRYAMSNLREDLNSCAELLRLAPEQSHKKLLLSALEEGSRGRRTSHWPNELLEAIAASGGDTLLLDLRRASDDAKTKALEILTSPQTADSRKIQILEVLAEKEIPAANPILINLALGTNATVARAALSALQATSDPSIAPPILQKLGAADPEMKLAILNLLSSRPVHAEKLLAAIKAGEFHSKSIPPEIVQRLRLLTPLAEQVEGLWPKHQLSSAAAHAKIQAVERTIASGTGDPFAGEKNFQIACGACHKLFGAGGEIGPDLTPFQRDNLETLLVQIVDPNAEIREGYENIAITTSDGRSITGFLADKDESVYVVRGLDGSNTTVRKSEVTEFKSAGGSLMPEGLLESFTEQELRDLFAYLRSAQPMVKRN